MSVGEYNYTLVKMFPEIYWKEGKPAIPFINDTELVDFLVEYVLDNYGEDKKLYINKVNLLCRIRHEENGKFSSIWANYLSIQHFCALLGFNEPSVLRKEAASLIKDSNPSAYAKLIARGQSLYDT